MAGKLTEKEFSQHLNTTFRVKLDRDDSVALELTEVKGYPQRPEEQGGMERFSVFFNGPLEPLLPQNTYILEHAQIGQLEIFIVPIARDERGLRYEAVFNYFK